MFEYSVVQIAMRITYQSNAGHVCNIKPEFCFLLWLTCGCLKKKWHKQEEFFLFMPSRHSCSKI
jgi:hypothetical protein